MGVWSIWLVMGEMGLADGGNRWLKRKEFVRRKGALFYFPSIWAIEKGEAFDYEKKILPQLLAA